MNFDENKIPFMESILEEMPGGFFAYRAGEDEHLLYINKAILRIFGCDNEKEFCELTGNTFKGMVYPEDLERVEESIEKQIANSIFDLDYVEYRIIQKDGSIRWVEDYGHYLHTEDYGDIFCVFIEDATDRMKKRITELERINDELHNAYVREIQYKKAVLYDAVSFFEVNLSKDKIVSEAVRMVEGDIHNLFEFMNIKPLEGYSDYIEFWSKKINPEVMEEYREFFNIGRLIGCYEKGELEQTFDSWIIDVTGRKRLCHYILLLGKNENTGDVVALFIEKDLTDQIAKQNLLKNALYQVETANQARNAFLFNMSHDIRTPLNAIIGYTELVKQNITEKDKIEEYIEKIRVSSEQLLSIVTESLEVTRMESGRASLVETDCHLAELFTDVEKTMQAELNAKSLNLYLDQSQVRHFAIVADYMRIKEILCQLLDNSVKYTNSGGNIRLTVTEKNIDFPGYGKYQFIVEDDGIGISKDFMNSLFEPFKRESNTTQCGVLGAGLGLTVVKNMIDMMGGDIKVESEPKKGSRFTVNLLLKLQEQQQKQDEPALVNQPIDEDSLKKKRILLVEDNDINMEIAQELLTGQGYLVETAQNGSVALDMVERSEPEYYDLILMDIQMPVMDGHEATRAIRQLENKSLAQIPIIALSANAFVEDYQKSIKAGMDAHFPKPIEINELQELIQMVLSNRK